MKNKSILTVLSFLTIPSLALAQNAPLSQINNANDLFQRLTSIGNIVVYLMIALAVMYIVWSTVRYFIKGESGDESRAKAGMQIMWGIIGLAIIVSLWGIVNILVNTFSTNNNAPTNRFPSADFVSNSSPINSDATPFNNQPLLDAGSSYGTDNSNKI